jgi:hypothetical protein
MDLPEPFRKSIWNNRDIHRRETARKREEFLIFLFK